MDVMPFRKRDGSYYFEAVEALRFAYENEAQFLALCPVCAAKYKEFVTSDRDAIAVMRNTLMASGGLRVPVSLGDEEASLSFVETHFFDLKDILADPERGRLAGGDDEE